jgi:hypothetical protein
VISNLVALYGVTATPFEFTVAVHHRESSQSDAKEHAGEHIKVHKCGRNMEKATAMTSCLLDGRHVPWEYINVGFYKPQNSPVDMSVVRS